MCYGKTMYLAGIFPRWPYLFKVTYYCVYEMKSNECVKPKYNFKEFPSKCHEYDVNHVKK